MHLAGTLAFVFAVPVLTEDDAVVGVLSLDCFADGERAFAPQRLGSSDFGVIVETLEDAAFTIGHLIRR